MMSSTSQAVYYICTALCLFTYNASAYNLRQCPYSGHWENQSVVLNGYPVDPCEVSILPEFEGIWYLTAPSDRDISSIFFRSMIYTESKIVHTKIMEFVEIRENTEEDVYDIIGPAAGKYVQRGTGINFFFKVQADEILPRGEKGYFTLEVKFDGPDGLDGYCVYQFIKVLDETEENFVKEEDHKDELG